MRRTLSIMMGMLMICFQLYAQNRSISGKVTDDKGAGIPNASVTVKGNTSIGTTTNSEGNFTLVVPARAQALLVSSVGLGEKEIALTSANTYNVTLSTNAKDMQEVVVVAYGTQKRADITGSVATVKAGEIEDKPFTSIDKALQGQIAGLQSVASSGAPGANQIVRIRGISSINASNAPLWVVDGIAVIANDVSRLTTTANILSTINPDDIESVTVLKDAASESIYGSRAANGVILITTKKGKAGKTKFRASAEYGQSDVAWMNDKYRPLTGDEYLMMTREGLANYPSTLSQATIDATMNSVGALTNANFDWLHAVLQKGTQAQYNISASGGDNRTTFYMSGGYFKQEGTVIGSDLDRVNGKITISNKATDKLTLTANINGGFVRQHTPLSGGAFGNPVLSSFFILPTRSAYKADGSFNILTPEFNTASLFNTVALASMDKRYLKELSIRGNFAGDYSILENLKFRSNFSYDLSNLEEDQYNNPFYGDGAVLNTGSPTSGSNISYATTTGRAFSYYTRYFNWTWTNTLNFHQNITRSGDFGFNVQAGYESQKNKEYFSSLQSKGFPLTLLLQYPSSGSTPITSSAAISDYTFLSYFSTGDINYKDRYIISGSFRRDGSSRFGPNNPYGNFWSIGGSWNVDKEDFMRNASFISQLKLRASYGVNGNAGIGNYDWFPSYSIGTGTSYNGGAGSAPGNVGNLDLTWELNKPLNIGLDLGLFKNRLNITADWYKRKSTDLLLAVQLSRTSGFTSQTQNVGALENQGYELTLIGTPVQTKSFTWTSNFNIAHNRNRVTSMPSPQIGTFYVAPGYDIQTFYARIYAGVDPATGNPLWYTDGTRTTTTSTYPAASSRVPWGSASPTFFGGWTNTLNYKGFSVEAQFVYQFGNWLQDTWGGYYLGAGYNPTFNKIARVLDRWQKPGDITDMPKYVYGNTNLFSSFSTFYLAKGDYIRLRNIQVGYQIPKSVLSKISLSSAFFYVRGTNIWTWVGDKKLGWDPEQGISAQTNLEVFIPKTVTVGINIGF